MLLDSANGDRVGLNEGRKGEEAVPTKWSELWKKKKKITLGHKLEEKTLKKSAELTMGVSFVADFYFLHYAHLYFFLSISKKPSTLITYKGIKFYLENSPYVVGRTGSSRFAATCTRRYLSGRNLAPSRPGLGARACWVSLHLTPPLRVLPLYLLVVS